MTTHLLAGYSSSSSRPHQQHRPAICNRFLVLSPMNQPGKRKPNANLPLSLISPYKAGPRADKKKKGRSSWQLATFIRFLHLGMPLCYLNFGGTGAFKLQALTAQQVKRVSCLFIFWHKVWEPPYFNNVT